jgi:hypothetical protein
MANNLDNLIDRLASDRGETNLPAHLRALGLKEKLESWARHSFLKRKAASARLVLETPQKS